MENTSLGFKKPTENEYYDIEIVNHNTQLANDLIGENSSAIGQLSNPPININPDFKIWQRYNASDATTFTNPVNKYIADRYRFNGTGTVKPVTNGAEIVGTINVKYILEDADFQKLNGKTLTRSWSENSVIQKETFVCNSAIIFDKTITNKVLNFIKIELGEIATPLSPRSYGDELALCQRYYEFISFSTRIPVNINTGTTGGYEFNYPFKTTKRIQPTQVIQSLKIDGNSKVVASYLDIYSAGLGSFGSFTPQSNTNWNLPAGTRVEIESTSDSEIY